MELYFSGTALLLRWESSLAAVAMQCCWGGKVLPLRWQCSARPVAKFCHGSERTLLRRWENFAFQIDMILYYKPAILRFAGEREGSRGELNMNGTVTSSAGLWENL